MSTVSELYNQLSLCLQNTRKLRYNVSHVITRLSDGVSFENYKKKDENNESDSCKEYLSELQQLLLEVNTSYEYVLKY